MISDSEKKDFISRLVKSSILALVFSASKMLDDEQEDLEGLVDPELLGMDEEDIGADTSELMRLLADNKEDDNDDDEYADYDPGVKEFGPGFNAFEEDPDDYLQGKEIGVPMDQLMVGNYAHYSYNPLSDIFKIEEDAY